MLTKIGFTVGALALAGITFTLVRQEQRIRELSALVGEPPRPSAEPRRAPASNAPAAPTALADRIEGLESEIAELQQSLRIQQITRAAQPAEPRPRRPEPSPETSPAAVGSEVATPTATAV